jgi:hypothetical protein
MNCSQERTLRHMNHTQERTLFHRNHKPHISHELYIGLLFHMNRTQERTPFHRNHTQERTPFHRNHTGKDSSTRIVHRKEFFHMNRTQEITLFHMNCTQESHIDEDSHYHFTCAVTKQQLQDYCLHGRLYIHSSVMCTHTRSGHLLLWRVTSERNIVHQALPY